MIFSGLLLALSLFAPCALAQSGQKAAALQDFSGGLNTDKSSLLIEQNETPAARNVIFDKSGGVTRREGFAKLNPIAISPGSINAVYPLEQSSGVQNCIAFTGATGYYSIDGCQTFTAFVTTLTLNVDINCDALQDRLYCVNGAYNFYFDGSDDVPFTAPAGLKYIRTHRNRCFSLGATATPSRVFYSALGNCASWTTSTDFFDLSPEDGGVGTGIGYPIFDMLPFYKKFSTWVLRGATPESWALLNISKNTGALNHRSIDNFNNLQLFDSVGPNGGRPGVYAFNGIIITEASRKLRNEIELLDTFRTSQGRRAIDTKADYDSGTFDARAMSSARDPGFMQSSYTALGDSTTSLLALGTCEGCGIGARNDLMVAGVISTYSVRYEADVLPASDGWTRSLLNGSESVSGSSLTISAGIYYTKSFSARVDSTKVLTFRAKSGVDLSGGRTCGGFATNSTPSNGSGSICYEPGGLNGIIEYKSGSMNAGSIFSEDYDASKTYSTFTIIVSTPSGISFYRDGVFKASNTNTYSDADPYLIFGNVAGNGTGSTANFEFVYFSTGAAAPTGTEDIVSIATFTSRIFDTAISTPIFGELVVSSYPVSGTTLSYTMRSSTSPNNDLWRSFVSVANSDRPTQYSDQYVQYRATFSALNLIESPSITAMSLAAASTGTWQSPEIQLTGSAIGSWGLFNTVDETDGGGADIAYCLKTSTWSGGTPYSLCTSVTPGVTIGASTGAYVVVQGTWTITTASDTARTDSIVINWTEGTTAASPAGKVFQGRYHYCGQPRFGTQNNTCYVLDSNNAWTKWTGVFAQSLNVVNQTFVMGTSSATGGGWVYELYADDSDDGTGIDAYWSSKDLAITGIENVKAIDRIFTIHGSSSTLLNMRLLADGGLTSKSYTVDLSTGAAFGIRPQVVEPSINGNTFRLEYSNTAPSAPWQILGAILYYRDIGMMPQ